MCIAIWFVVLSVIIASTASFTSAQAPAKDSVLDLKPIEMKPEPVGELHPALQWLKTERVRGIWLTDALIDTYGTGDKTKGQVLAEAGFNLIVLYSPVPDPKNIAEAHRHGMKLLGKVQYGTSHQEPYRRYREPGGKLHKRTCCPLDHDYIERHVDR